MSQHNPGQIIQVPNTLRLKVGGRFGSIDSSAIAKAEAALKSLAGNFSQWLQDELDKLEVARQRIRAEGVTVDTTEQLYYRAHDLKGLGATYGFPLITRIAGLLCRHIDDKAALARFRNELAAFNKRRKIDARNHCIFHLLR